MHRYTTLIVDKRAESRTRLKEVTSTLIQFGEIHNSQNIKDALKRLAEDPVEYDVVFVSSEFSEAEVAAFIAEGKAAKRALDAAFVLVLKGKDQESSTVAQNVIVGADGFLFEPYSVDGLVEITKLATKVRKERSGAREKAAMGMIIGDVMKTIDKVSMMLKASIDISQSMKKLRDQCGLFKGKKEAKDMYLDSVVDKFEEAKLPAVSTSLFKTASRRVKKMLEEKYLSDE